MKSTATITRNPTIPPLENGDQLTLAEFERRYSAMADLKKAELIEGIVYMASPLRITQHGEPHAQIMLW
ncbi:MAG: Uma2 family endonuclease, partial [Moorea sp. SIO3I6]|nr:Uma2 family endonuclease [Moorena sp. SIO3I6]